MIYVLRERKTWTIRGLLLEEIEKERERRAWKLYDEKMALEEEEYIDSEVQAEDHIESEDVVIVCEDSETDTDDNSDIELRSVTGSELF